MPFPFPGDLPYPGIEAPDLLHCRQILYHLSHQGRHHLLYSQTFHTLDSFKFLCIQNFPKYNIFLRAEWPRALYSRHSFTLYLSSFLWWQRNHFLTLQNLPKLQGPSGLYPYEDERKNKGEHSCFIKSSRAGWCLRLYTVLWYLYLDGSVFS